MDAERATGWKAVAAVAARQHGLVTIAQLFAAGVGKGAIEKAVRSGRLHRVHRGVYAVGHAGLTREARWLAAVLACGPGAVLGHRSAATAWGIRDGVGPSVDVVTTGAGRRRSGITVHRAELEPFERRVHRAIPITSPARTIVDLAHELRDPDQIAWAVREMQYRRLFDRTELELCGRRRPSAAIRAVLEDLAPSGSPLEVAFLRKVVHRHGLPEPDCQAKIEGFRVDFRWAWARLIVEVDGSGHDAPAMRTADAVRDNILGLAGELVLRYRGRDVHRHHARTAAQIAAALATRGTLGI